MILTLLFFTQVPLPRERSERIAPRPEALVAQGAERGRLFGAPPARLVPPRCRSCLRVCSTPSTRRVIDRLRRRTDDATDACTFVQEAGDVVLVPANWAHAILNEAPVVGAAFERLDAYLIASNSRRVFA